MIEQMINRLEQAKNNLNNEDFLTLFPIMLNDLEYIIKGYKEDEEKLSPEDRFMNGTTITKLRIQYLAELAKLYFNLRYNVKLKIVNSNEYSLALASGGYKETDDTIYYSDFGVILSQQSELSFLHTCLHEGRHKLQHQMYKSNDILSIPPYMLRLLKEDILQSILPGKNRAFYLDNYSILFTENDAEIFAREEIHNFINYLTEIYVELNPDSKKDDEIIKQANEMNDLFEEVLKTEEFRIDPVVESQIYEGEIINSNYQIEGATLDRLIMLDKCIKHNPNLQHQFPILKLLFNGDIPKNYEEIISEKDSLKVGKTEDEQQHIDELYEEIIRLDPILTLTEKLELGDLEYVQEYLLAHPTISEEYKYEIADLREKYGAFGPITK